MIAMADRGDGMLARGNGDGGCDGYGGACHFQSACLPIKREKEA